MLSRKQPVNIILGPFFVLVLSLQYNSTYSCTGGIQTNVRCPVLRVVYTALYVVALILAFRQSPQDRVGSVDTCQGSNIISDGGGRIASGEKEIGYRISVIVLFRRF